MSPPAASPDYTACPDPGIVGDSALEKTAHGLLFRQIAGDSDNPLDASAFSFEGTIVESWGGGPQVETSRLVFQSLNEDKFFPALLNGLGDVGEAMIYAVLSHGETGTSLEADIHVGLVAMSDGTIDPDLAEFVLSFYRMHEDDLTDVETLRVADFSSGGIVAAVDRSLSGLHRNIHDWAWQMFQAKADGSARVFDGFAAQLINSIHEGSPPHDRVDGRVGVGVVGSSHTGVTETARLNRIYVVADGDVTIQGVPPDSTAEVVDENDNILASGVESGGEILIDMMVLGDQVVILDGVTDLPTNPSPADAVTLVVRDKNGGEIDRITPTGTEEGVWGGDIYSMDISYAACPPSDTPTYATC